MSDLHHVSKFAERRRRNNIWRSVVTFVAALVVFCTTYALILPAITMETEGLSCGMEAHTHTEECCQLTCGKQEYFSHTHTEECYEEEELICPLEERTIHHHTDDCYSSAQPICGLSQCEPHAHSEGCYGLQNVLICGQSACEPHAHGESCYTDGALTCTLEETAGHTHTEECYEEQQALTCTLEETEGHTHTEECYPSDFEPKLICEQEDIPEHRHTEDCYIRTCEKEAHIHTDECVSTPEAFLQNQNVINPNVEAGVPKVDWTDPAAAEEEGYYLICGNQEEDHIHSQDCYLLSEDLVDWSDPTSAASAGFVLLCEEENEEHVHTEDCYAFDDSIQGSLGSLPFRTYTGEEASNGGAMLLADDVLPVGANGLSATGVVYNAQNDTFSSFVTVKFLFPKIDGQKAVSSEKVYSYTYPDGIIIPDALLNTQETLLDKDGITHAGTYRFTKDDKGKYSVHATFFADYVADNSKVGVGEEFEGYINYGYEFSGSQLTNGGFTFGNTDYVLPVSGDINYPDDITESYDIDVSKEGSWVRNEDKLVYTVYVRTTKGTPSPISLTDTLTAQNGSPLTGLTLGNPTISVEKGTTNCYPNWSQDVNDWTSVSDVTHSNSGGILSMSLPGLNVNNNAVDSNGSACIARDVYRITYSYPVTDQTVESIPTKNKVVVTAYDAVKKQTVTDEASASPTITKDFSYTLSKNGEIASDKVGKYFKWTVTLNTNEQDLSKAEFTDDMLKEVQDSSQDIIIDPKNNINVDAANGKITFTPVENGVNKNTYTITYYTPYTETWNGTTKTNKATLVPDKDNPNDKKKADATVTVSGVQLSKDGGQNPVTKKLDWVITVNAGELDIAGATLTDDVFTKLNQDNFTIKPETGYDFVIADGKITGIKFPAPTEGGENRQTYVIKYSTDVPTDESGSQVTSVTNEALLTPRTEDIGNPVPAEETVRLEEVSLSKSGNYNNQQIEWTVKVNSNHKNIANGVLTDQMMGQLTSDQVSVRDSNWQQVEQSEYEIVTNEAGKVTHILFKPVTDGVNEKEYIVFYKTAAFPSWKDKVVNNEVTLTLDGKDISKTGSVTVPGSSSVEKVAGQGIVDGNTLTIPWTVTLTIPKGGMAAGTTITDDVTKNQWGNTNTNQWITASQKDAWERDGMTWTWIGDDNQSKGTVVFPGTALTFSGEVTIGEDKAFQGFTITLADDLIPPDGAQKLTFTYNTTSNLTDVNAEQTEFYNFVDAGGKQQSAKYIYYKPSIKKTDGKGQTGSSTVSSPGSLTWKVIAKAGTNSQKITLVDTLPEGVTLGSLHLTGGGNLDVALTVADGQISGTGSTNQYSVSGKYEETRNETENKTERKITLDISPAASGETIADGAEFTLTVNCIIPNAENVTGTMELTNTVVMNVNDVEIGSSSQTQNWTYQEDTTGVVSKTGKWNNNTRLLTYSLDINPDGRTFLPNSEPQKLRLEDVLRYNSLLRLNFTGPPYYAEVDVNISLNPSSVKLKNLDTGEAITDWSWDSSAEPENNGSTYVRNSLIVMIPDGVPLRLEYSYTVSSSAEEGYEFELDVENSATLQSLYSDEDKLESGRTWSKQTTSGGVSSSSFLKLTKVDAQNNGKFLSGAEFSVYSYRKTTTEEGAAADWEYEEKYVTDGDGTITIVQSDPEKKAYDSDVLYKVVETKAPFNYLLPDSPKEIYFYFSGDNESTMVKPDGFNLKDAIDLKKINSAVIVKNTMSDNPTYTLPNTGGAGTGMFTVTGLAVSIGACLGLVKKRRKGER